MDYVNPRSVARKVWDESGYDYSVLTENNLLELIRRINANLDNHRVKEVPEFKMWLHYNTKRHGSIYYDSYSENGKLIWVEITVDGSYFKNREAITFNSDGFVGFAGWACDTNAEPFVNAFIDWVYWMKKEGIVNTELPPEQPIQHIEDKHLQTKLEQYEE